MDIDFKRKQSVLTKYHIDPDTKKPITIPVTEKQQVHPLKNLIQMVGEVKKNKKIQIIDRDMIPVNKPEKITRPYHYYVDYEQNLIHFHPDIAGQTVEYKYEDMGVTVISANKIFTKQDEKGNVVELLQEIIDLGREAVDVMMTIGGVAIIMKRLEDDIKEGYEVSDKIQADIQQAKDEILNVRGNREVIIQASQWTLNADVYEKEITHDLNSENLHVTAKNSDTKEAVTIGYKILDKTRILLKSDEAINMSIILSASYYHATQTISDDIAEEVIKARKGEVNLKAKIDNIDRQLDIIKNDTVYAKDYGVVADGITDDTEALQNAINSLRPKKAENLWDYQNCGGTVILPKGNMRITDTIRLYSNIKLVGTNKSLFGRVTNDTCIILDTTDKAKQAISFVGLDPNTSKHMDKLFITGDDMDNGIVTQTWNVTLESFTIKSKNGNDLAVNLSCAVKSKINNISFNNFDVDIFTSANWDNEMNNCNTLCNFSHMVLTTGNSLLVNSAYVNPGESPKVQLNSTHTLYSYVNNENLIYKNTQTGIINIGLHGLNIEKPIIEKLKIGIQVCMDVPTNEKFFNNCSMNKIHMEHIEKAFVFKNIACLINGVYAYIAPNTSEYLIEGYNSHVTGINIQPIKWIKLFKEDNNGTYNFFGSVDEWVTNTNITKGSIGKTIFECYNDQAIRKTWQTQVRELIGDTVVETQYVDLKDIKTCVINSSKLVITSPPDSPVDVRYSNTVILNSSSSKTIYSFRARDFQEFNVMALNNNISLNGRDSEGKLVITGEIIDPIPSGGVIKFICYDGVCYEVSRSF